MELRAARPSVPETRDWWWVFDPRMSLRAAAALFVGLGTVLLTILIAWIAGRNLHHTLEQQAGMAFEALAVQMSDRIDRTLYERYRTLQFAANLDLLRSYATPVAERRRALLALQDATPDFAWLGFADAQGRLVAATRGYAEGTSVAERRWYRTTREQSYAGGPREAPELPAEILPPEEGEPAPRVFDLAVAVLDADGRFAGVLAAHVRWGWTREVLAAVVPEAARREHQGITVYSADGDVLLDSGSSGWTRPPDFPALPDRRRLRGHLIEPTSLGTTYLTGYARSRGYREYRGLGWITALRQPVAPAFAPVAALRDTIARWGFGFALAGMLVAWLYAARLSRRLRAVGTAAGRIQGGDVLARLPSGRGEGELARMCGALNRLVDDLREKKPKP
jgi:hypothetical protein